MFMSYSSYPLRNNLLPLYSITLTDDLAHKSIALNRQETMIRMKHSLRGPQVYVPTPNSVGRLIECH